MLQDISNFKPERLEYKSIFESFISQENVIGLVAIVKDEEFAKEKVVGFGSLHYTRRIRGGTVGFIEDIAVLESFRKKGIGKLIVKNLIDLAKKEDCFKLVLDCKENKKIFYKKLGFYNSGFAMSLKF